MQKNLLRFGLPVGLLLIVIGSILITPSLAHERIQERDQVAQNGLTPLAGNLWCLGHILQVAVVDGDFPMVVTGSDPTLPRMILARTGSAIWLVGPRTWESIVITEMVGDLESIELGPFTCPPTTPTPTPSASPSSTPTTQPSAEPTETGTFTPTPESSLMPPVSIPQNPALGMIKITTEHRVPVFDHPAGNYVRIADGRFLTLPNDWDSNGYDTYLVWDMDRDEDGELWLGITLGAPVMVWVKANQVIWLTEPDFE